MDKFISIIVVSIMLVSIGLCFKTLADLNDGRVDRMVSSMVVGGEK